MGSLLRTTRDLASPSELLLRSVKQAGVSLTLGVFLGAAVTSGVACGVLAFYLANEKVLRRLKGNAAVLVTATRDAVLSTQEGRALVDAVLPPKPGTSGSLRALVSSGKKAVCVGKNYREHISELAQLGPEWTLAEEPEPVLFLKPTTSYAWPGAPLVLPQRCLAGSGAHGVHHELELAVIIGERVRRCADDDAAALRCVAGYVLALDITDRDAQTAAKVAGMPWSVCKGHDTFLPLSEPFTLGAGEDWSALRLWLSVNGERRQACEAGAMIHGVPALVRHVSSVMTLEPGDLIVTGTPAGVGRLLPGDRIAAGVEGKVQMTVDVVAEEE